MVAVMETQQYWLVLKRRWLPATSVFVTVIVLSVLALIAQQTIYQAEGKIRFTRNDRRTALTGVGKEQGGFDPLLDTNNPITTEMEVIRSVPIVQATIQKLNLKDKKGVYLTRDHFLRNLILASNRGTDMLTVAYRDSDGDNAKAIVSTLMSIYIENHLRENRAEVVAARQFIEQQLPEAEASVHKADETLRKFQEANQVAELDEEKKATVTAIEDLRRRIADSRAELANAKAQSTSFQTQLDMQPQEGLTMASLNQSVGVQEALRQLQSVESLLSSQQARFQDDSPVIQQLKNRKRNLESLLAGRVAQTLDGRSIRSDANLQIGELRTSLVGDLVRAEVRREGLTDQVAALSKAQDFYQQRILSLPRLEQEQRELIRRLEAAQATYSLLLQRLYEARVTENQNVGNARIVQAATTLERPVSPRLSAHLLVGGILGLLGAIATVLALESQDQCIRTVRAARELFGYPLLGVVPSFRHAIRGATGSSDPTRKDIGVIVRDLPLSPLSETYRILQANLKFLSVDQPLTTIVISSSVAGEGKSILSANLAMAIAQLGNHVLLVDADLRSPGQHSIWNVTNETGLSNVIIGILEPEQTIQSVAPNLDLLTAGVIPTNPTALLDSQRMASLIQQFAANYQFVIIDTPPVSFAADASILGKLADGFLLVVRPGVVDVVNAALTKERLEQSGQNVLGQVINGVGPEHEPYSYYYYHFNQGYGTQEGTLPHAAPIDHTTA